MAVRVKNRGVTLASRPAGFPTEADFALRRGGGRASRARARCSCACCGVSVDPYQRGRMSEARSYAKPLELGDVMTSQAIGEVVESNDARFSPGDLVVGQLGWQEYAVVRAGSLRQGAAGPRPADAGAARGRRDRLHRVLRAARRRASRSRATRSSSRARAGAVGQIVGQIAKIAGCRTVGIAGGPDKARELHELYGYDVGDRLQERGRARGAEGGVPGGRRRLLRQRRRRDLRRRALAG